VSSVTTRSVRVPDVPALSLPRRAAYGYGVVMPIYRLNNRSNGYRKLTSTDRINIMLYFGRRRQHFAKRATLIGKSIWPTHIRKKPAAESESKRHEGN